MSRIMCVAIFLFTLCVSIWAQTARKDAIGDPAWKLVQPFILAMKTGDRAQLAKFVRYPFDMPYPVPNIKDEKDFVDRYNLIFDETLEKLIINSKADDWATYGWRGIAFDNGELWFDEEYLISSRYSTQAEKTQYKKLLAELIAKDKAYVPRSTPFFINYM